MKLSFVRLILGPLQNNVYLLADEDTRAAVVIDPSFNSQSILDEVQRQGWHLTQIWLTHAHYDHVVGVSTLMASNNPPLQIGMHPDAYQWVCDQEPANKFGLPIEPLPEPDISLQHGQRLPLQADSQDFAVEVLHAPGHSPGSVIFYCSLLQVAFCGDVIFRNSIGRTDLPGGDYQTLLTSIKNQVFTLPESTTLLPGHGPESSVGFEKRYNPYLA